MRRLSQKRLLEQDQHVTSEQERDAKNQTRCPAPPSPADRPPADQADDVAGAHAVPRRAGSDLTTVRQICSPSTVSTTAGRLGSIAASGDHDQGDGRVAVHHVKRDRVGDGEIGAARPSKRRQMCRRCRAVRRGRARGFARRIRPSTRSAAHRDRLDVQHAQSRASSREPVRPWREATRSARLSRASPPSARTAPAHSSARRRFFAEYTGGCCRNVPRNASSARRSPRARPRRRHDRARPAAPSASYVSVATPKRTSASYSLSLPLKNRARRVARPRTIGSTPPPRDRACRCVRRAARRARAARARRRRARSGRSACQRLTGRP